LRALARSLDETLGPDTSEVAFTFDDGWSIRRLLTLEDQIREGELMHHCMRYVKLVDENAWSLRDAENLPHLTFSMWWVDAATDLAEILAYRGGGATFVHAADALFLIGSDRQSPKEEHLERLRIFGRAGGARSEDVPELPPGRRAQIAAVGTAFAPAIDPALRRAALRVGGFS
jgi:hypothetical protein